GQWDDLSCDSLMSGDINFDMVSSMEDSFGLVTLVELPEGMELFVTDNAWAGPTNGFQTTEGTLKVRRREKIQTMSLALFQKRISPSLISASSVACTILVSLHVYS
ncbi:MAG: hypothetical protein ACK53L_03335, partial [Pirellulaceae bacterium]